MNAQWPRLRLMISLTVLGNVFWLASLFLAVQFRGEAARTLMDRATIFGLAYAITLMIAQLTLAVRSPAGPARDLLLRLCYVTIIGVLLWLLLPDVMLM